MKHKFIIIITGLILFSGVSCTKNLEDKVDGTWRRINVATPNSDDFEEWKFETGNFSVSKFSSSSGTTTLEAYGEYEVKYKKFVKRYIYITKCSDAYYQANFRIDKLSKTTLTLYRDNLIKTHFLQNPYLGPLEYLEFVKQ
mgnify:CR=1 FL=1